MKRKVKQVIALACGFGLLCSSAQAATLIGYDAATRTLQIKGDFAESAAGTATFSILPAGVDPQSVDAETANAADMLYRTVAVQDDGSVTSTIVLPICAAHLPGDPVRHQLLRIFGYTCPAVPPAGGQYGGQPGRGPVRAQGASGNGL